MSDRPSPQSGRPPSLSDATEAAAFLLLHFFIFYFFWLRWVFVAVRGGYSSLRRMGFSLRCFSCCRARALGHAGFSSCSTQPQ